MFRLYIDETGNSDLGASSDENHRFLSLTGIIVSQDHAKYCVYPELENLKQSHLGAHPDEPIVLHRKDIIERRGSFRCLRSPDKSIAFDADLLRLLSDWEYAVVTVVIDKLTHLNRYSEWHYDPYHYCLEVLLERYMLHLRQFDAVGDVMAETRNHKVDNRLKQCFETLYGNGTGQLGPEITQQTLTSKALKMKGKDKNVAGLQVADLLANPCCQYVKSEYQGYPPPDKFGGKVLKILKRHKFRRGPSGALRGYGIKMLP